MKINKPFSGFIAADYPKGSVTQWFGENEALYQRAVIINGVPLKGHNGHDYVAPWGTPLLAVADGIICDLKDDAGGYGKHVRIFSETSTKGGNEWTYGHLSLITCKLGDKVKAGDQIGLMGNTGFVVSSQNAGGFWKYNPYAGTHLHFGLRQMQYKKTGWQYPGMARRVDCLNYDNGYFGAIDFKDMLDIPEPPKIDWNTTENFSILLKILQILRLK